MSVLSAAQIASAAGAAGFGAAEIPIAVGIALAESGGNTDVTHHNSDGSTDYGVWQINSVHADLLRSGDWRNPNDNARMAYAVYRSQGWHAWSTYNNGAAQSMSNPGNNTAVNASWWNDVYNNWKSGWGGFGAPPGSPHGIPGQPGSSTPKDQGVPQGLGSLGLPDWLGSIGDPNLWRRIGLVSGGVLLAIVGIVLMMESNKTIQKATEVAAVV